MEMLELFKKVRREVGTTVTDYTRNGVCSGCGNCCSRFLPISEREATAIDRYIAEHKIKEQTVRWPTAQSMADWTCPFLDKKKDQKKCTIYPVRPAICRDFRCDKAANGERVSAKILRSFPTLVDMRETFFRKE